MTVEGAWVFRLFDGGVGVRLSRGLYVVPNQVQAVTVEQLNLDARVHIHLKGGASFPVAKGDTREMHEMAKDIVEQLSSYVWESYPGKLPDFELEPDDPGEIGTRPLFQRSRRKKS